MAEAWIHNASEDPEPAVPPAKSRKETLSISERKEFFLRTPTSQMKIAMKRHVATINALFRPALASSECWLHPRPPEASMEPTGSIKVRLHWTDSDGAHTLDVNYGVITLLLDDRLSEEQIEGFVHYKWHLSHLCGNWTCCNPQHFTLEDGSINQDRNRCFKSEDDCPHHPQCKKTKKRSILMTQKARREIYKAVRAVPNTQDLEEDQRTLLIRVKAITAPGKSCNSCHRQHILADFCVILDSPKLCRLMLGILATEPSDVITATQARVQIVKHYRYLVLQGKILG